MVDTKTIVSTVLVLFAVLLIIAAFKTKEYSTKEDGQTVVKAMTTKTRMFVVAGVVFWTFYILHIVW